MERPRRHTADPYDVLGVAAGASRQDIVRAYRRAVHQAHPDAQPRDPHARARFQALSDAYGLLSDPERRAEYDRERERAAGQGSQPPGPASGSGHSGPGPLWPGAGYPQRPPYGQPLWPGPVRIDPPASPGPRPGQDAGWSPAAEVTLPAVDLSMYLDRAWMWL